MYARPAFLSHDERERIIEESTHTFCDYIRLHGITRSHEDASTRERNDVQSQGVVQKAGALTEELSTAMSKIVADQNDQANVVAKKRIEKDMLFACRFVETVVDRFNPFVRRLPVGDRSKKGSDEKPYQIRRKDVPDNRIIIEYPKNSQEFYILDCPICEKSYEMLKDLYYHIMSAHSGIITGEKSYIDALEIGGIRITNAERKWVKDHNEMCRIKKSLLYFKVKKQYLELHKDDDKDTAAPANTVDSTGEASATEGSANDGNSNNASGASDTVASSPTTEASTPDEANGEDDQAEGADADGIADVDEADAEPNAAEGPDAGGVANTNADGAADADGADAEPNAAAAAGADADGVANTDAEANATNEEQNDAMETETTA